MFTVEIDSHSGFCFGVVNAIRKVEEELNRHSSLYCLGDIVHNSIEMERLHRKGLQTITHEEMAGLQQSRVLFRAHGEPPSTYQLAKNNRLEIVDATCPVVLHLQKRIRKVYLDHCHDQTQLLIFGKIGHAEVNGLVGQTDNTAVVIEHPDDLKKVRFDRPIVLFSQTTKSQDEYQALIELISQRMQAGVPFERFDTICKHFSKRLPRIQAFAQSHDCILFASDPKSSNGKALLKACKTINPHSYFVSQPDDIVPDWFEGKENIGICGATSTPTWLMEQIRRRVIELLG